MRRNPAQVKRIGKFEANRKECTPLAEWVNAILHDFHMNAAGAFKSKRLLSYQRTKQS